MARGNSRLDAGSATRYGASVLARSLLFIAVAVALAGPTAATSAEVTAPVLAREWLRRVKSIPEFAHLADEAERRGVRLYLFGGAATGMAFRVRNQLWQEQGLRTFCRALTSLSFGSLFLPGQDIDVVLRGTKAAVEGFAHWLRTHFPKETWDVWTWDRTPGFPKHLKGNSALLLQHTDDWSTVLFELTAKDARRAVSDFRAPRRSGKPFLEALLENRIRFLWSERHGETPRAVEGLNPPWIAAIRFLVHRYQFGLDTDAESDARVRAVVRDFVDGSAPEHDYVREWLAIHAPNILRRALDADAADRFLETTGLRGALLRPGTLALMPEEASDWIARRALPRRDNPAARVLRNPRRAADIPGLHAVTHVTTDVVALLSLLRTGDGRPNFLVPTARDTSANQAGHRVLGEGGESLAAIARRGPIVWVTAGETAVAGAKGFAVTFDVDPEALEGRDFYLLDEGEADGTPHVLWLTTGTLRLRDRAFASPENFAEGVRLWLDAARGGTLEVVDMVERQLRFLGLDVNASDPRRLVAILEEEFRSLESPEVSPSIRQSGDSNDLPGKALARLLALPVIVARPEWPDWMRRLARLPHVRERVFDVFRSAIAWGRPDSKALFFEFARAVMEDLRSSAERGKSASPKAWRTQDCLLFPFAEPDVLLHFGDWPSVALHTLDLVSADDPNETRFAYGRLASWMLHKKEAQAHPEFRDFAELLLRRAPEEWVWMLLPDNLRSPFLVGYLEIWVDEWNKAPGRFTGGPTDLQWILDAADVRGVDVAEYEREIAAKLAAGLDEVAKLPGMAAKVAAARRSRALGRWLRPGGGPDCGASVVGQP